MLIAPPRSRAKIQNFSEDEITSTVFGPLRFVSPQQAWKTVCAAGLVKDEIKDKFKAPPECHSVEFWKYYENPTVSSKSTWKRGAPDALFCFDFTEAKLWLSLEVKWKAGLSSKDQNGFGTQLAHQWIAVNGKAKAEPIPTIVRQVYLARYESMARSAIEETRRAKIDGFDCDEWLTSNPVSLTWYELAKNLERSSPDNQWADATLKFLKILNILPFQGFRDVVFDKSYAIATYRFSGLASKWREPQHVTPYRFARPQKSNNKWKQHHDIGRDYKRQIPL